MGRRRLAIGFVVLGALGWQIWGREGVAARELVVTREPARDARVVPAVLERVARAPALDVEGVDEEIDPDSDPDAEPVDADGLTIEERWAGTVAELEDRLARDRGAVQGRVEDLATAEPLAGATVVLTTSGRTDIQAVITDADGFYALSDLEPGEYLATFYFLEITLERTVTVTAREATPVFVSLMQPIVDRDHREDPMPDKEELARQGISLSGVESQNNMYYVDSIDTTGLYFGEPDDTTHGLAVSFSGTTTLDNHYVIDGEDTPGITLDKSYTHEIHIEIDETGAFQETE